MHHATDGSNADKAKFTSDEVVLIRNRYVSESAREIYKDYQKRCSYNTFQQILTFLLTENLKLIKKI